MSRETYISPQTFLVLKETGIIPTVPDPPTLRKYHANFLDTDLEIGNWCRNLVDGKLWFRNEAGIVEYPDDLFGPATSAFHTHDDRYYTETEINNLRGAANGIAELDGTGKVPTTQLPSYVDDVIDVYIVGATPMASDWLSLTVGGAPLTPETGIIYVIITAGSYQNKVYRWSGTVYIEIGPSPLVLGETSTTAYRGDRGKIAYDHRVLTNNPHGVTAAQAGALASGATAVAAAKLLTTGFSIEEVGGVLVFKYGATVIASLSSAGYLKTKDEVEPFADI